MSKLVVDSFRRVIFLLVLLTFVKKSIAGESCPQGSQLNEFTVEFANPVKDDGSKQVVLVTGANRGIGYEVCKQLAKEGYKVIVTGRDEEKVTKAAETLTAEGYDVDSLVLDATKDESVANAAKAFAEKYETLDALVNNFGGGYDWDTTASTIPLDRIREVMEMNLFSAMRVTQAFIPYLKEGSRVVYVGSGAGTRTDDESGFGFNAIGNGSVLAYGVSKMALNGCVTKLALEFKEKGIMFNSTCPGYTDSAGNGNGRPVSEGAASVAFAARFAPGGPTGMFFRDGKKLDW